MKRYALIVALVMALAASIGCAKKTTTEPAYEQNTGVNPALQSAVQTITDSRVYFAFNKYNIESQYDAVLKQDADLMRQYPSIRVRIEGNCDERGTQEYNLALGERRARAVYDYFVATEPAGNDQLRQGKSRCPGHRRSSLEQEPPRRFPRHRRIIRISRPPQGGFFMPNFWQIIFIDKYTPFL